MLHHLENAHLRAVTCDVCGCEIKLGDEYYGEIKKREDGGFLWSTIYGERIPYKRYCCSCGASEKLTREEKNEYNEALKTLKGTYDESIEVLLDMLSYLRKLRFTSAPNVKTKPPNDSQSFDGFV